MGQRITPKAKGPATLPVQNQQDTQGHAGKQQAPPPFQMKAGPVQLQAAGAQPQTASKVTKTPEEIAAKKAKWEADASIIKPGQDFVATDPDIVNATLEAEGYKRIAKMDESINICDTNIAGGVNPLCVDRIKAVNKAYNDLKTSTDPAKQAQAAEIKAMLQKAGGAVFRVQKKNFVNMDKWGEPYGLLGYRRAKVSNHALGCAIDVNANTATMQNAHFEANMKGRKKRNNVMEFVEKVVKQQDPTFDLDKTKGVDLMNRINKFSDYFPAYFETLMADYNKDGKIQDYWTEEAATLKLLGKNKKKNKELKLILDNWTIFKGWANGTSSKKFHEGDDHKVLSGPDQVKYGEEGRLNLKGIVDINATFLQMMLDAGWKWLGDDGRGNKDFMHFEDADAMAQMRK